MMNASDVRNAAKSIAMTSFILPENITKIDDSAYVFPVMVEGEEVFVKVALTTCNFRDTEKTKKFNLDEAVAAYESKKREKAEKAIERANKPKKSSKPKERDIALDNAVLAAVHAYDEAPTVAQIHADHFADELNEDGEPLISKQKVMAVLKYLVSAGSVIKNEGKPATYSPAE